MDGQMDLGVARQTDKQTKTLGNRWMDRWMGWRIDSRETDKEFG